MRVCMLSLADIHQPYGSTARPVFLGKHLARLGVEFIHICEKLSSLGGNLNVISLQDHAGRPEAEVFGFVREQCRQFSPELIYSHQVYSARMGLRLSRLLKRPHVYDAHSSLAHELSTYNHLPLKDKLWRVVHEALVLRLADRIIVPSVELKEYFVKKYRIRPDKIRIVKNGVETDVFKPSRPDLSLRETLGIPREAILVAFTNPRLVTFPSNEMALRSLFRMIPEIERKASNLRFLILGGGPELPAPSPHVIYTGFVNDIQAYLNLADLCIAPYPPEAVCGGTRNKICEYLACGKPVVATREAMRGFDDAVPGEHFVLAEDEADFASKLVHCIHHPEQVSHLGQNARKLSERYDWSCLAAEIQRVFQEVAQTRATR